MVLSLVVVRLRIALKIAPIPIYSRYSVLKRAGEANSITIFNANPLTKMKYHGGVVLQA